MASFPQGGVFPRIYHLERESMYWSQNSLFLPVVYSTQDLRPTSIIVAEDAMAFFIDNMGEERRGQLCWVEDEILLG